MSDIESICGNRWSSKAAAADMQARIEHGDPFIALWLSGPEKDLCWSKANLTFSDICVLCAVLESMKSSWSDQLVEIAMG